MVDTPRELPENLDSFSLSLRELLVGAGAVVLGRIAGGVRQLLLGLFVDRRGIRHPKRGGNFRLAVTGGGARSPPARTPRGIIGRSAIHPSNTCAARRRRTSDRSSYARVGAARIGRHRGWRARPRERR